MKKIQSKWHYRTYPNVRVDVWNKWQWRSARNRLRRHKNAWRSLLFQYNKLIQRTTEKEMKHCAKLILGFVAISSFDIQAEGITFDSSSQMDLKNGCWTAKFTGKMALLLNVQMVPRFGIWTANVIEKMVLPLNTPMVPKSIGWTANFDKLMDQNL